jgi:hypothetical protein
MLFEKSREYWRVPAIGQVERVAMRWEPKCRHVCRDLLLSRSPESSRLSAAVGKPQWSASGSARRTRDDIRKAMVRDSGDRVSSFMIASVTVS